MKFVWRISLAVLLICLSITSHAETFKCKLPDGTVTYQDRPCVQSGATQQQLAVTGSVLALTLSEATMIGVRAGIRQHEGTLSKLAFDCLMGQDNSRFYSTYQRILSENMNPADLKAANEFFDSPVGRKFAKRELSVAYKTVGQTAPEPLPIISAAEENQISEFKATSAGQMLITNKFMNKATLLPAVFERAKELRKECGGGRY
jgi:hypothetical protein